MPFLTTPTSSRDLPWMDVRYTSYARTRTHAHTATQKSATSHLMDLKKKKKTHHKLICGWEGLPAGKGTEARRTGQGSAVGQRK